MNEPFPEELLSAYLDGELPREERARVEQWLAASADHRRLFDDLQAIRRELQALPKQSLDAAFSDRVLAAIRERSGGSAETHAAAARSSSPAEGAGTGTSIPAEPVDLPPKHLGMPAWRWFVAGVAATLLAVIVGMNAAPETMALMGKLAQVRLSQDPAAGEAPKQSESPPGSGVARQPTGEANGAGAGATPLDRNRAADKQLELRQQANKDTASDNADNGARKETAPGETVEPGAAAPAPAAPSVAADTLIAPGAAPESAEKKRGDGRNNLPDEAKKPLAEFENRGVVATFDDVAELQVTGEQADRALAFYAGSTGRQAARRYIATETLSSVNADEEAADRFAEDHERETVVQRTAPGMSLMKLMDAATQGVHVSALEVAGPEAEVQALLDSLGVDGARDLRPSPEQFGGGGGAGGLALRANRQGEESAAGAVAAGAEAKPAAKSGAAAAKSIAKADGPVEKAEAGKGAGPQAGLGGGRGGAGEGGFPTVKMQAYRGSEGLRRARDLQQEGGDASQPQLRVRLVIVPDQADPVGPAIEVQPK